MPQRPIEQDRHDTGRLWPTTNPSLPPVQARYVGHRPLPTDPPSRPGRRPWAELDRHPVRGSARRHLDAR